MANTTLYKVAPQSSYPTFEDVANVPVTSEAVTSALTARYFYAYTAAYTTNSNGSTQGTENGYRVKIIVWFENPDVSARSVHCGVALYMRRTDGYTSNNTITINTKLSGSERSVSKQFKTTSSWQNVIINDAVFNYDKNGDLYLTYSATGSNETGSLRSIENCTITFQAPKISTAETKSTVDFSTLRANIGSALTFSITKSSSTKTTLAYKLKSGSDSGNEHTIVTKSSETSYSWTVPLSIANTIPNDTSVSADIIATTYGSDGSSLGSNTYSITFVIDSSKCYLEKTGIKIKDTATGKTTSPFIKDTSKLTISFKPYTSSAYGATLKALKVTLPDGQEKSLTNLDYNAADKDGYYNVDFTTALKTTGKGVKADIVATDSRGFTTKYSTNTFDVVDYYLPVIDTLTCTRGNGSTVSEFVENDEGEYVRVYFSASSKQIATTGTGSLRAKIQYKKVTEDSYTNSDFAAVSNNLSTIENTFILHLSAEYSYVIRVTITDDNSKSIYKEETVAAAYTLLEFSEDGKGISIGTVCSQAGVTVQMDTRFYGKVYNSEGGVAITSDENKKNNIIPLRDNIDIGSLFQFYNDVEPISFQYNDAQDELTHYGFSAQNVRKSLEIISDDVENRGIVENTESIKRDKQTGKDVIEHFLTLRYEEITPLNFLAIKMILLELNNINKHLKEIDVNGQREGNEQF